MTPTYPAPAVEGRVRLLLLLCLSATALVLCVRTVDIISGDVQDGTVWRSVDTRGLVAGADVALDCARDGLWRGCGLLPAGEYFPDYPEVPGSRVDRFPPLLYVPALLVQGAGGSQTLSLRVIGALSLISFGVLVALPWLVGRRVRGLHRHRHLWAIMMLASPLLPYAGSTWSEVHAAALFALTVALVAAEAPPASVGAAALCAGLSKDTAPIFVIMLSFAVARHVVEGGRVRISPALLAATVGSITAIALTAAFNVFRYDSLTNLTYLASTFQVRRPAAVAGHGLALVASPNGGLLPFWPAAVILLVLASISCRRNGRGVRVRLLVVGLALAGFMLSLAMWWSPFGWAAWSPRLSLPLLPALAVAVLVLAPPNVTPQRRHVIAAAALLLVAVPQAGVAGNAAGVGDFMVAPRPACPLDAQAEDDFVRCNLDRAWRQQPGLLLEGMRGLGRPMGRLLALSTAAAGLALLIAWKEETSSGRSKVASADPGASR